MLYYANVMTVGSDETRFVPPSSDDTAVLRKIVRIIVRDFNGDTSAYFDSIQPDASAEQRKADETESRIAHRFTKSI